MLYQVSVQITHQVGETENSDQAQQDALAQAGIAVELADEEEVQQHEQEQFEQQAEQVASMDGGETVEEPVSAWTLKE